MIRRYDEDLDRLYLPRGLVDDVVKILQASGSHLQVDDRRPSAPVWDFTFTGQLSADQEVAVAALAAHEVGVLVAPTGAGKTVMACGLIARIATPTLILVHTKPLTEQWRQRLGEFLGLARRQIGQLGAGRPAPAASSTWRLLRPWLAETTRARCLRATGWSSSMNATTCRR
jgi:superfamily II DNA or RNA helicase